MTGRVSPHLMNTSPPLAAFDYTHVLYDSTSTTAEALALITLSPILLFASYAALIVWTREITMITMVVGQLLNEALNTYVKEFLQVERPLASHGTGYGFPSSHSQYMGYFSTFLLLHFTRRHVFPTHGNGIIDALQRLAVYGGLVTWAGLVAYSRYFLKYHTPLQVLGGLGIGIAFGAFWHTMTEGLPLRYPQSLPSKLRSGFLDSTFAQWIRIRDGWAVYGDGGHDEEWVSWRRTYEAKRLERRPAGGKTKRR